MYRHIIILFFLVASNLFAQESVVSELFLKGVKITDMALDDGKIWISTEGNGVYELFPKEKRLKNFSSKNKKLSNDLIFSVAVGGKFVFAGSIDGLFIYDKRRRRWSKRKFGKGGQLGNYIRDIEYDKENKTVWIGRFQFLTKFDVKKRRFKDYDLTVGNNSKTNSVTVVKKDFSGNLWVGTEAGVYRIDLTQEFSEKSAREFFDKRLNYFPKAGEVISISALLFERNYVWIGCNEFVTKKNPDYNNGGLYRFDGGREWVRFDKNSGLPANGISALERVGNYIFAGVYKFGENSKKEFGRGIAVINRIDGTTYVIADEKLSGKINVLLFDGKSLWAGTENGLVKVNVSNKLLNWSD